MERIRNEKIINIPNCLTMLRIALLPAVVWRFRLGDSLGALYIYLAAMLTDVADGLAARMLHQITSLGKLLDPIADKLSLMTLLTLFVLDGQISAWVLSVLLVKEALLVIGSAVALKNGLIVQALPIGKVTTAVFAASMALRFLSFVGTADVLLGVSVVLSTVALLWYGCVVMKELHVQSAHAAAS